MVSFFQKQMRHFLALFLGSLVFVIGFCQFQNWEYTRDLRLAFNDCNGNKTDGRVPTFKLKLDGFIYCSSIVMIAVGVTTMGLSFILILQDGYRVWLDKRGIEGLHSDSKVFAATR